MVHSFIPQFSPDVFQAPIWLLWDNVEQAWYFSAFVEFTVWLRGTENQQMNY